MKHEETVTGRVSYEISRARRYGVPLTVVLVGQAPGGDPPTGDLVAAVQDGIRTADLVWRLPEDRALVLLPHTGFDGGMGFARRIVRELAAARIAALAGVASVSEQHRGGDELIAEAQEALSKASKDNPVAAFGESPLDSSQ
jgi:hypothetical protein